MRLEKEWVQVARIEENSVTNENDKKKEYLRGYLWHGRRIKRIEAELEEVRRIKKNPSMNIDGMPHARSQKDLSGYVAHLDALEEKLYEEGVGQVKTYKDISWRIGQLQDENERDVMFYRYIKGLKFWEIAQQMGYDERQIHRFHGSALTHLDTPEDVSSCQ